MSKEKLYIFDTTLRDGAQTQGVDFSIDDKEKISVKVQNILLAQVRNLCLMQNISLMDINLIQIMH